MLHYLGFCWVVGHSKSSQNERRGIIYGMIKCRYYIQGGKNLGCLINLVMVRHAAQIFIGFFLSTNKLV